MMEKYLDPEGLSYVRPLGHGSAGRVDLYRAQNTPWAEDGEYLAVKWYPNEGLASRELAILNHLHHNQNAKDFVVKLFGVWKEQNRYGIALEAYVAESGWLSFDQGFANDLSIADALISVAKLGEAVTAIHQAGVTIGDIQSTAFFVSRDRSLIKVIDYSLANFWSEPQGDGSDQSLNDSNRISRTGEFEIDRERIERIIHSAFSAQSERLRTGVQGLALTYSQSSAKDRLGLIAPDFLEQIPNAAIATPEWSAQLSTKCKFAAKQVQTFLDECLETTPIENSSEDQVDALSKLIVSRMDLEQNAIELLMEAYSLTGVNKERACRNAATLLTAMANYLVDRDITKDFMNLYDRRDINEIINFYQDRNKLIGGVLILLVWARRCAPEFIRFEEAVNQKPDIELPEDLLANPIGLRKAYQEFLKALGQNRPDTAFMLIQPWILCQRTLHVNEFAQFLRGLITQVPIYKHTEDLLLIAEFSKSNTEGIIQQAMHADLEAAKLISKSIKELDQNNDSAVHTLGQAYGLVHVLSGRWDAESIDGVGLLAASGEYAQASLKLQELFSDHRMDESNWWSIVDGSDDIPPSKMIRHFTSLAHAAAVSSNPWFSALYLLAARYLVSRGDSPKPREIVEAPDVRFSHQVAENVEEQSPIGGEATEGVAVEPTLNWVGYDAADADNPASGDEENETGQNRISDDPDRLKAEQTDQPEYESTQRSLSKWSSAAPDFRRHLHVNREILMLIVLLALVIVPMFHPFSSDGVALIERLVGVMAGIFIIFLFANTVDHGMPLSDYPGGPRFKTFVEKYYSDTYHLGRHSSGPIQLASDPDIWILGFEKGCIFFYSDADKEYEIHSSDGKKPVHLGLYD